MSIYHRQRYVPLIRQMRIRSAIGLLLLLVSVLMAGPNMDLGDMLVILAMVIGWVTSVFLTDKYIHKYPQRYFTYLLASHIRAAVIMGLILWILSVFVGRFVPSSSFQWKAFFLFVLMDALISVLRRKDDMPAQGSGANTTEHVQDRVSKPKDKPTTSDSTILSVDKQAILSQISANVGDTYVNLIREKMADDPGQNGEVLIVDAVDTVKNTSAGKPLGLIVNRVRINDIRDIDPFFAACAKNLQMGGYFVGRYVPHDYVKADLKARYSGLFYWPMFLLHFIWHRAFPKIPWLNFLYFSLTKGKNRVISKVEVWGRLAYCGITVVGETEERDEVVLIAQRVGPPVQNSRPSYYPIVALEKVGLDGNVMYAHKLRTMYPYSEFLQKRVFEEHGLASTGKFKDDFRRTEYGRFLRKYWLDELPQAIDLLCGDIKLVGMRATSPHFLSLYPQELYDLYIQIKPGIISPIFDDSVTNFDQIAEIELAYLRSYWNNPIRTDIKYLFRTFTDIVFRGVRSK